MLIYWIAILCLITSSLTRELSNVQQQKHGILQRNRRNDPIEATRKPPVSMAATGNESNNNKDNEDLKIGLIVGGICAVLIVLGLSILTCRCYDKHESIFYSVEKRTRLSQIKREEAHDPYTMVISPEAEVIELDETDGKEGGFERPLTTFQPYTGTFTAFPGKNNNFTSNNRDSGISLLDILDERDKTTLIDPLEESTFAREGTVHNPLYQDHGGVDNEGMEHDDDDSDNEKTSEAEAQNDEEFPNIFDDSFFKEPITLLSYAKKHEEDDGAGDVDSNTMSIKSGQSDAPSDDREDSDPYQRDFNENQSSNTYEDIKEREYEDIRDATNNTNYDDDSPVIKEPDYATIPRNTRPLVIESDSENSSPEPSDDEDEEPSESPKEEVSSDNARSLLRTGSVAKLVNAFLTGDVNKRANDSEDDISSNDGDQSPVDAQAYKNPNYQREKTLLRSYSNPLFEDEDVENSESKDAETSPVELKDENHYLKAVDSPVVGTRISDPTLEEEDTFNQYLDQSTNANNTDDEVANRGLLDSGDFTPKILEASEPINNQPELFYKDGDDPAQKQLNKTPVPAPRKSIKIVATSRASIKSPTKKDTKSKQEPSSKPPPPPVAVKPTKSFDRDEALPAIGSPTKKQPPPVAPKQFSIKRGPVRSQTVQPVRRAPAPPPRVPSVRY
uniref:Cnidarian restricted protein n=1 Tax=Clytia hemisphaerica TaxID=252671 RepID=A0A7M5VF59_9CNID